MRSCYEWGGDKMDLDNTCLTIKIHCLNEEDQICLEFTGHAVLDDPEFIKRRINESVNKKIEHIRETNKK
jgi:hypothetical protein